jgi:hypothetical protein
MLPPDHERFVGAVGTFASEDVMKRSAVSLVALVAVSSLWACGGAPGAPAPLGTAADGGVNSNVEGPGNPGETGADGGVVTPSMPRSDAGRDGSADGGEAPEPPPPPTKPNEITEQFGVFVSTSGQSGAPGTRTAPLATIAAAVVRAKAENKAKVFVCEGSYAEALEVTDGVSIEGRIDCSTPIWTLDPSKHVDLVAPSSPALRATNVVTPTRIDGLYVSSPDATVSSESSIAFVVTDSNALTFANGRITAGAGAKGDDGVEGETLAMVVAPAAEPRLPAQPCVRGLNAVECVSGDPSNRPRLSRQAGARATCRTLDGRVFANTAGGEGGAGGLYDRARQVDFWTEYFAPTAGLPGTGTGADGTSGTSGTAGGLTVNGYTPGNGTSGTAGAFGMGGRGGAGIAPSRLEIGVKPFWGSEGGGGGAGGCQGLPGTPGQGGGASIAVLSVRSALGLEKTQVASGAGGSGGTGTFGSMPSAGSLSQESQTFATSAEHGKRGGFAGISGHGASGPSFGIVHTGGAPTLVQTQITPGAGGAAVPEGRLTMFGVDRVIPASAAGESAATRAF